MSNEYDHTGIECTIVWSGEDRTTYGAWIMFGEAPENDNEDDDRVFYYLDETEKNHLYKCVSERREQCSFNDEWFIDLMDDYGFITTTKEHEDA